MTELPSWIQPGAQCAIVTPSNNRMAEPDIGTIEPTTVERVLARDITLAGTTQRFRRTDATPEGILTQRYGSAWDSYVRHLVPTDHHLIASTMAANARGRAIQAVRVAYEAWRRDQNAETRLALAEAVGHLDGLESRQP